METKTIKVLKPPTGEKKPGFIEFTDGTKGVKYFPWLKYGAEIKEGVAAPCEIEDKEGQYGRELVLKVWGNPVEQKKGMGGYRGPSPEERRSIAAQTCLKAASELHQGTGDTDAAIASAKRFMAFHDSVVRAGVLQ